MTDKEQIEEVTKIINKKCEAELGQVHANSKDGKVTKTVDTSLIAKDIVDTGYQKIVWHKVADGNLPKEDTLCLCYVRVYGFDRHGNAIDGYSYRTEPFIREFNSLNASVIAWTELPKYKENKNE